MPAWTTEQITKLRTWINQGARNNACDRCDTTDYKFSTAIKPLLQNKCQGCHNPASKGGNIDHQIADITSVLTVLGGRIVHAAEDYDGLAPVLPPAMPDWSPVNRFGGYHVGGTATGLAMAHHHHHGAPCSTHGAHGHAAHHAAPTGDLQAFWGAMGCSCFAF